MHALFYFVLGKYNSSPFNGKFSQVLQYIYKVPWVTYEAIILISAPAPWA